MQLERVNVLLSFVVLTLLAGPAQGQTSQDVSLEDMLDRKVSAASKYEQSERDAPASITIITADEIERYGYQTLVDVFAAIRGFYVSNDRNYDYVGVRGFGRPGDYNNRVLVLINGVSVNEDVFGGAPIGNDLCAISLRNVERIEIVRGAGSALYGTGAVLAVVNVVTMRAQDIDGVYGDVRSGSLGETTGSVGFGKRFDNGLELTAGAQGGTTDGANLYYPEFDSPATNRGVSDGLDWDRRRGGFASVAYGDLRFQAALSYRDKGIPTGPWGIDFNNDGAWTIDEYGHVVATYERNLGARHGVLFRVYNNYYHYKGSYPYDGVGWLETADGRLVGTEGQYRIDTSSNNRLILGSEYQYHYRVESRQWDVYDVYFDKNAPFSVASVYIQDEYQVLTNLSLLMGARHDEYSTAGGTTTPRLAAILAPTSTTAFKFLYGRAFRAPNFYERDYTDSDTQKANHGLKPEQTETMEVVVEQQVGKHAYATVSVYQSNIDDLIDTTIDPADSLTQFNNVGEVRSQGVEVEARVHMAGGISGYASYSHEDARDRNTGSRLSNSPEVAVKAGVTAPLSRWLVGAVQMRYESSRITVRGTHTGSYYLFDTNLIVPVSLGSRSSMSFQVRNLFDESYAVPGGFEHLQDAIVQDGRTAYVRMNIGF